MTAGVIFLAELPADAVAVLDETLAQVERTGERCLETELLRMRGEARAAHGAVQADVEHDLRAALALATERGDRSFRLHAAAALARYQLARDVPVDAGALDAALAEIDDDLDEPDVQGGGPPARALRAHGRAGLRLGRPRAVDIQASA